MITKVTNRVRGRSGDNTIFVDEMYGLSTDTKPSADNGDIFLEMDTSKVFMYDKDNSQWREL